MNESITPEQISEVLAMAAARDQRTVGDADSLAWYLDLNAAGVTYRDAEAALTHYYAVVWVQQKPEHRFRITAPQLIEIVKKARARRLEEFAYAPPPDGEDEPGWVYVRRLRQQIRAAADGVPVTTVRREVGGGAERMALIVGEVVARSEVPAADGDPRVDAEVDRRGRLGVPCPTCGALVGLPCKAGRGGTREPHIARRRVADGQPAVDAGQQAEAEARRAAAAAALAQLTPEQRAELAEFRAEMGGAA